MGRKIVVTSGKGGVGKTTLTASLGIAIAETGKKVVLVDADIGLNNLDVVLAVENKVVYDVLDVISGKCRLKQALIQDVDNPTLYVLPSAKNSGQSAYYGVQFPKRRGRARAQLRFRDNRLSRGHRQWISPRGIGGNRGNRRNDAAYFGCARRRQSVVDTVRVLSYERRTCREPRTRRYGIEGRNDECGRYRARRQMRACRSYPRGRLHHDVFADGKSAFRHDLGARFQDACVERHKRHEKHLRLRFARGARHKNQEVFRTVKKTAKLASERLKNVILSDKVSHPDRLNDLLKSDVNDMLKTYFELYPGSIKVCLKPSEYGLDILIDATAIRVKDFGSFGE